MLVCIQWVLTMIHSFKAIIPIMIKKKIPKPQKVPSLPKPSPKPNHSSDFYHHVLFFAVLELHMHSFVGDFFCRTQCFWDWIHWAFMDCISQNISILEGSSRKCEVSLIMCLFKLWAEMEEYTLTLIWITSRSSNWGEKGGVVTWPGE